MFEIPINLVKYTSKGHQKESLNILEQSIGFSLPVDFQELLLATDGLSLGGGVLIYGLKDLIERNETWEVEEYTPGFVAIDDSGGGDVFLMKLESVDRSIYAADAGVMDAALMQKSSEIEIENVFFLCTMSTRGWPITRVKSGLTCMRNSCIMHVGEMGGRTFYG